MDGYRPKRRKKPTASKRPTGRFPWRRIGYILLFSVLLVVGFFAGLIISFSRNLPDISRMADYQPASATRIYARDGSLLASVYTKNRVWVPISRIPKVMQEAVVANEDHNFYTHHGVDPVGILRAAFADMTHQQFQGASTITQQLARNLFLNDEISIKRKIEEALLAIEIERYYTKDEILERYLNLIYLGAGAYGVDAAAHTYFGTSVDKLDLAQAATLAGIIAAPSDYSPFVNPRLATDREHHVLDRMVDSGYITVAQATAAKHAPIKLTKYRTPGVMGYRSPWFTTYAISRLETLFGAQAVREGGLQVYTTMDPVLEREAQNAVDWGVAAAKSEGIGAHQAALVAIRPSTGEIVAMIGGTTFSLNNQFNRAWQALRQPGSSFKAYVYSAAIDSGYEPSTLVDDAPISYPMGDGTKWSPMDDDNRYMGMMTLRRALALSRNVVAVRVADRVGLDKIIEYAHRMGVRAQLDANLSLALGSSVVSVLDQASGYSTLANGGIHNTPTAVRLVKDSLGNIVLDHSIPRSREAISAGTAYLVTSMLEDVIAYGTGTNANIGRPAAGKTGTTTDFRDAWFVGYTPDLVTAVWLGNDDYSRMSESYGGNIPARIWARFMRAALAKTPPHPFIMPSGQVERTSRCGTPGTHLYLKADTPISPCAVDTAKPIVNAVIPSPSPMSASSATPMPTDTPATSPPLTPEPSAAPTAAPTPIPPISTSAPQVAATAQPSPP